MKNHSVSLIESWNDEKLYSVSGNWIDEKIMVYLEAGIMKILQRK